jgi:hypothetical protein
MCVSSIPDHNEAWAMQIYYFRQVGGFPLF